MLYAMSNSLNSSSSSKTPNLQITKITSDAQFNELVPPFTALHHKTREIQTTKVSSDALCQWASPSFRLFRHLFPNFRLKKSLQMIYPWSSLCLRLFIKNSQTSDYKNHFRCSIQWASPSLRALHHKTPEIQTTKVSSDALCQWASPSLRALYQKLQNFRL